MVIDEISNIRCFGEGIFISCILLCLLDSMLYALYYHEKQSENEYKPTNQNAKMLFQELIKYW